MSEQEFMARDAALLIEINEERGVCVEAQKKIMEANVRMIKLNNERIALKQAYVKSKFGEQNHD